MKKINSIWFGGKIIGWGITFSIIIPFILLGLSKLLPSDAALMSIAKVSVGVGAFILIVFAVILSIELNQDKKLDLHYEKSRCCKIKLSDSTYECQNCGNKRVKENDKICMVCGVKFM